MSIFQQVKTTLEPRLPDVLAELLPNGKLQGHEYVCASLQGGEGTSCSTNTTTGKGSELASKNSKNEIEFLQKKLCD